MFARTGIDARKFVGAVVTHEHGDHAAHIGKYADRAIDVYASQGTLAACRIDKAHRAHTLRPMQSVMVGDFVVRAFDVKHDAAEPFGVYYRTRGMRKSAICYRHAFYPVQLQIPATESYSDRGELFTKRSWTIISPAGR